MQGGKNQTSQRESIKPELIIIRKQDVFDVLERSISYANQHPSVGGNVTEMAWVLEF